MEKLKSYIITRLLLLFAGIAAAESIAVLVIRRVLLPYAAVIAHYSGDMSIITLSDMLRIMSDLVAGRGGQVVMNLLSRSAVISIILTCFTLILLPAAGGILLYAGAVTGRIDRLQKAWENERAERDAQRNLMFSDFAHDLRTPIMTISGYAGALADGVVKDEGQKKEYLNAIRTKSGRMTELINLLFDYTKLGSVNFHLSKERIDFNELLREVAASVFSDFEEAGMEFLAEIPEEPYFVEADRAQVSRVFHNLLINIIRHNPAGTEAAVSVRRKAGMEMIAVADTGIVIEKSGKEIFEPFVKGDNSRSESTGSGLGLSIVKKITDMHGWEIGLVQPFGNYTKAFVIKVPER